MLQLRSQRYHGNVVQAAVDLHQILHASTAEGPEELLRVGSLLLHADEGALEVKPCRRDLWEMEILAQKFGYFYAF